MKRLILFLSLSLAVLGQKANNPSSGGSATAAGSTGDVQCKASNGNLAACGINDNGTTVSIPSRTLSVGGRVVTGSSNPAVLSSLGRAPRILIIGDSIINSSYIVSRIQTAIPNTTVEMRTYGGSESPIGLMVTASDVQAYTSTGNLLNSTVLSNSSIWLQLAGVTSVVASTSPTTGAPNYLVTANGGGGQRIAQATVIVPTGAPDLVFSVEAEPGTTSGMRLLLYDSTKSTQLKICDFTAAQMADRGNLPTRYSCQYQAGVDGYSQGDTLLAYIYINIPGTEAAGTLYLSNPLINAGDLPSVYHATTTPETASSLTWTPTTEGIHRDLYDLVVLCIGTNDMPVKRPLIDHQRMMAAMVSGAYQFAPRVLVATRPPLAAAGLAAWDNGADPSAPYLAVEKKVALSQGAFYYDAWTAFQALTTAGTYTVAQLMRDLYHPTDADASSPGIGQYVAAIVAVANSPSDVAVNRANAGPSARLGGQVVSGTWAWTPITMVAAPKYEPHSFFGADRPITSAYALVSSGAGAQLTYTIPGEVIGVCGLADSTTDTVDVAVDGQPPANVTFVNSGLTMYPNCFWAGGNFSPGMHTVTVSVATGTARIFGVVSAPGITNDYPALTISYPATVAKGSIALATSSISANSCQTVTQGSVNSAAAAGVVSTDVIAFTPNGSIKALTGYTPTGTLTIVAYPTAGYINFDVCNKDQSNAVSPSALSLNYRVSR